MDTAQEESSLFAAEENNFNIIDNNLSPSQKNPTQSEIDKYALGVSRQDSLDLILETLKGNCDGMKENSPQRLLAKTSDSGHSLSDAKTWHDDSFNIADIVKYIGASDSNSNSPNLLNTPNVGSAPQTPGNPLFGFVSPFTTIGSLNSNNLSPLPLFAPISPAGRVMTMTQDSKETQVDARSSTTFAPATQSVPEEFRTSSVEPYSPQSDQITSSVHSPAEPVMSSRPQSTMSAGSATVEWHALSGQLKREPAESPFDQSVYSPGSRLVYSPASTPVSRTMGVNGNFYSPRQSVDTTVDLDEIEEAMEMDEQERKPRVRFSSRVKKGPVDIKLKPPRKYNRNKPGKDTQEYRDRRDKNNEAVRKSREKARMRNQELEHRNQILEEQNRVLIQKYDEQRDIVKVQAERIETLEACLAAATGNPRRPCRSSTRRNSASLQPPMGWPSTK